MALENKVLDHFLHIWRKEVTLKSCYTPWWLGWDEVDAYNPAVGSSSLYGNLILLTKSRYREM